MRDCLDSMCIGYKGETWATRVVAWAQNSVGIRKLRREEKGWRE